MKTIIILTECILLLMPILLLVNVIHRFKEIKHIRDKVFVILCLISSFIVTWFIILSSEGGLL